MSTYAAFLDELEKIAVTRSVKEWRRAAQTGAHGIADQIAAASGKLGLKPRYLHDVSIGGAEAGVDRMIGHVRNAATGEANTGGYLARKLYKPDSQISRGDYTTKLLEQKQQLTNTARAMSPEARSIVPNMYGHQTLGTGPMQRHTSYHEYVPNTKSVFDQSPEGAKRDIDAVHGQVLSPLKKQYGQEMRDTVTHAGVNDGNVVSSPTGPKILDFLPHVNNQPNPAIQSYVHHASFNPTAFDGERRQLPALRKEVFKPQMNMGLPGSADHQRLATQSLPSIPAFQGQSAPVRKAPGNSLNWGSVAAAPPQQAMM